MKLSRHESKSEDQAALWAAKIDGSSLTSEERVELDAWLAEDARNRTLLSSYCQFSADLEQQLPLLVAADRIPLPAPAAPARRFPVRAMWFAGTLAAAAAVAVAVWVVRPMQQNQTVATALAERKSVTLPDGSVVELNARTSLLVDLGAKERHIRMSDGEAFFTVAKDKSRPFIVDTPAGSVRVTGTVFNVHADTPVDLAVTVVEGSVQVNPCQGSSAVPSAPASLKAGDQLIVRNGQAERHVLDESDLEDALSWRHGDVVFKGTPLASAVAQFQRYHGRTITVAPSVANLSVGGRYHLDDLDSFLNDLERFLPVVVSPQSSGAIAVAARPGS